MGFEIVVEANIGVIGRGLKLRKGRLQEVTEHVLSMLRRIPSWLNFILIGLRERIPISRLDLLQVVIKLAVSVEGVYEKILARSEDRTRPSIYQHKIVAAQRPLTLGAMNAVFTTQIYIDYHSGLERTWLSVAVDRSVLFVACS